MLVNSFSQVLNVHVFKTTVNVRNPNSSDFRHLPILPFESLFGSKTVWNPNRFVRISNVRISDFERSNVRISDIYGLLYGVSEIRTPIKPNVRNPNDIVPNKPLFGFQRYSDFGRSVFGRLLYNVNQFWISHHPLSFVSHLKSASSCLAILLHTMGENNVFRRSKGVSSLRIWPTSATRVLFQVLAILKRWRIVDLVCWLCAHPSIHSN